jgi:DNA repair protein RecO (recombination protein O)
MSLVDMVAERKNKVNFDYVKEIKVLSNTQLGEYDIVKSSICMFLNEILYKLLSDAGEDKALFEFLFSSIYQFFTQKFSSDFHLRFLTVLMRELGSSPENNYTSGMIFSIEKSRFTHDISAKKEEQMLGFYFHRLLEQNLFPSNQEEVVPYSWRNPLLEMILHYYTLHITDLSQIKSHEILKTVLHA